MTGLVVIPNHESWQVANVYFGPLMERAVALSTDPSDRDAIEMGAVFQSLNFKSLTDEQAPRIARTLINAAQQIRSELIERGTEPRDRLVAEHLLVLLAMLQAAYGATK